MNIEDKLELVKDSQVIVGIKEGMFVRFTNNRFLDGSSGFQYSLIYQH
ncbi:hypothetical protein KIV40_24270 [Vibrio sp. D173a]|nr:hypothetical protein [Vibrio sp. D173a]MDK9758418.1 hypothetical protein [Vibrio sp. D173a]